MCEKRGRGASSAEAVAETALVATASAINPAAGVIAAAFFAALGGERVSRWLGIVDDVFDATPHSLDPNDPQLVAAASALARGAAQTSREEKWRYLAVALSNSGAWSTNPDFIVEHFATLAANYSPEHVQILALLHELGADETSSIREEPTTRDGLLEVIQKRGGIGDDLELVFDVVLEQLHRDGLVAADLAGAFTRSLGDEGGPGDYYSLTVAGERFHAHVTRYPS
ncbi:hypothetical protein [uncultured Microbacterium sp.]|uniref:hypothetical protein n=1 Tax=uncultured Microbacterium sp. TaxID=191216 RepID=UPI0025FA5937|nr:hypothetical protein [uncultured Microbacterium sp.]